MKYPYFTILTVVALFLFMSKDMGAQCSIENAVTIPDLQPVSANLVISGAVNNDLSTAQGVCGIALDFEHNQVGDLTIELTSPSGQTVVLLGPTGSFGNTAFTNWNVLFVPCGDTPSPDPGFLPQWNNNQSWGLLQDYTGSYHPYIGCLEDFNTGTVDGIWSIQILDNTMFDQGILNNATIFFCDPAGLSCNQCEAFAGTFDESQMNVCSANADNLTLTVDFDGNPPNSTYEYYSIISNNDVILDIVTDLDMSAYAEGIYNVCGLSLSATHTSQISEFESMSYSGLRDIIEGDNPTVCGDLSDDCVEITIVSAVVPVDLDVTVCTGGVFTFNNIDYSLPDNYEITVETGTSCDSIYNLQLSNVDIQAIANATNTTISCAQPSLVLDGSLSGISPNSEYRWISGGGGIVGADNEPTVTVNQGGIYTLQIIDDQCISSSSVTISVSEDTPEITLTGGTITCSNPSVLIELESDVPLNSTDWVGPNGFTSTMEDITVTEPGIYTVSVISGDGCMASKSITINSAGEIPTLTLQAEDISCGLPQVIIQVTAVANNLVYSWTGPNGYMSNVKDAIVTEAGIYTVVATDPFGCSDSFQIEIFGNSSILSYELLTDTIICPSGAANLQIIIADPGALVEWTLPDNSSLFGLSVSSNQAGTHTVEILSNGCSVSETFEVEEDLSRIPTVALSQNLVVDCANPDAILTAEILTNADQVEDFYWVFAPSSQTISQDLSATASIQGQYAFFINTIDGCLIRSNITLQQSVELPDASIFTENITCTNPISSLIATSDQSLEYSWTGPNAFTSQDSALVNIEGGNYFLTITNDLGCTRDYFARIVVDTIPRPLQLVAANQLDCNQDSTLIQPLFPAITNISWTSSTGFTSSDIIIKVGEPGFYYLEGEGIANGCISFDTIEILEDLDPPLIDAVDQSFNCGVESIILQASSPTPNVTYSWSGPAAFTSNIQNPLITEDGQYTVRVTRSNGCFSEQSIQVTQNNVLPNVDADFSNDLNCIDTQADIIGTSSTSEVTFQWTGPNNFVSDQPVVTIENAGEYIFYVTGTNGCVDSMSIDVPFSGVFPEFDALGDTLFCGSPDVSIDINEITSGVSYQWTGPNGFNSTDNANAVIDSGLYILTGVGMNNCITVDSAYVVFDNQAAMVTVDSEPDTITCFVTSQEIDVVSDKIFSSTAWTGPNGFTSTDEDITVTEGGMYTFTGISLNNCEVVFEVEIEEDIVLPQFSIVADEINCDNNKATITLDNIDLGAVYSWSGEGYTSDLQSPVVENGGEFFVTVTGSNGCELQDSIIVDANLVEPIITVVNDTLPCDGSPLVLFLETDLLNPIVQWIGPNGFDSTSINPLTNMPGQYFVEVTGPNGCSTNETVTIGNIPLPPNFDLDKSSNVTCDNRVVTVMAVDVLDDKSFSWTGPDNFTSTSETFETNNAGTYYLEVEGNLGCFVLDSIVVELDTIYPVVLIEQAGLLLCDINEAAISAVGTSVGVEYNYEWTTEDGNITFGANSLNPIIQGEGTYTLYIEDESNGCFVIEDLIIEEQESTLDSMFLGLTQETCQDFIDGRIEVIDVYGGFAPYRYAIEGTSFSQNAEFSNLQAGSYMVSVKDSFGCVLDTVIDLGVLKDLSVDLGDDLDISLGEIVNLEAETNFPTNTISEIVWTPAEVIDCIDCLSYEFAPDQNVLINIFLTDNDGCTTSDQVIIRVDEDVNIYIPNIFSPNDDGINDEWFLSESSNIEVINYFNVYDRWGSKVFSDEDFIPGNGKTWNGQHNGNGVMTGVYVYLAEVVLVNGKKKIIKGNITVIR